MSAEPPDSQGLLELLAELGRLDLDLLVRDQSTAEALRTLQALRPELQDILARGLRGRAAFRAHLAELEVALEKAWPGVAAAEILQRLAEARRGLAELDTALQPAQGLHEEIERRCSRRPEAVVPTEAGAAEEEGGGEVEDEPKEPDR